MAINKKTGKPYESSVKASAKYDKEKTRSVRLKLSIMADADILAKLDTVPSKMGYIKSLIRADIAKKTAE